MKDALYCLIWILSLSFLVCFLFSTLMIFSSSFLVYIRHKKNGKYKITYKEIKRTILNSVYYSKYFDFLNESLYLYRNTFYLSFLSTIMMMYWCEKNVYCNYSREMTNLVKLFIISVPGLAISFLILCIFW